MKKYYSEPEVATMVVARGPCLHVQFEEDNISLDIPTADEGWKISPLMPPVVSFFVHTLYTAT